MELFGSAMMSLLATDFKGDLSQKEQKFRITVKQSLEFLKSQTFLSKPSFRSNFCYFAAIANDKCDFANHKNIETDC